MVELGSTASHPSDDRSTARSMSSGRLVIMLVIKWLVIMLQVNRRWLGHCWSWTVAIADWNPSSRLCPRMSSDCTAVMSRWLPHCGHEAPPLTLKESPAKILAMPMELHNSDQWDLLRFPWFTTTVHTVTGSSHFSRLVVTWWWIAQMLCGFHRLLSQRSEVSLIFTLLNYTVPSGSYSLTN